MDFANYWYSSGKAGDGPGPGDPGKQIGNALRLRGKGSYLTHRQLAGDRRTFTYSTWFKKTNVGKNPANNAGWFELLGEGGDSGSQRTDMRFEDDKLLLVNFTGGLNLSLKSDNIYRDPASWMHVMYVFDTPNAGQKLRTRVYINGEEVALNGTFIGQNSDTHVNNVNESFTIGDLSPFNESRNELNGYLAETYLIDGQALEPTDFGRFNDLGIWVAKEYEGQYGINGFYLPYDNPYNIGEDASTNNPWSDDISGWMRHGNSGNYNAATPIHFADGTYWDMRIGGNNALYIDRDSMPPNTCLNITWIDGNDIWLGDSADGGNNALVQNNLKYVRIVSGDQPDNLAPVTLRRYVTIWGALSAQTGVMVQGGNGFAPYGIDTSPVGIFSNNLTTNTSFDGGNPPTQAFDNNTNSFCQGQGQGGVNSTLTFAPANPIKLTSLEAFSPGFTDQTISFGGTTSPFSPASSWVNVPLGTATEISTANPLVITRSTQGEAVRLCGIRVNGVVLVNNTGSTYDNVSDSPSDNYAVLNNLNNVGIGYIPKTFKGALQLDTTRSQADVGMSSTFAVEDDKYYWEVTFTQPALIGVAQFNNNDNFRLACSPQNGTLYADSPFGNTTVPNFLPTAASGTIGVLIDNVNKTITMTLDGVTYATPFTYQPIENICPFAGVGASQPSNTDYYINYGQIPFVYPVPSGAKQFKTDDFETSAVINPSSHFKVLYGPGDGAPVSGGAADQLGGLYTPYLTNDYGNLWYSGLGPDKAFNYGNNSAVVANGAPTQTIMKFEPPGGIPFTSTLKFATNHTSTSPGEYRFNGGAWIAITSQGFAGHDISQHASNGITAATGSGTLNTFELRRTENADTPSLFWIEVDGKILVDYGILAQAQSSFDGMYWIKDITTTSQHQFLDTTRIWGDVNKQAINCPGKVPSGYVVPSGDAVAYCWRADEAWSANAGDNGATTASSGLRNSQAGFCITRWNGNGSTPQTLNHGLLDPNGNPAKPDFFWGQAFGTPSNPDWQANNIPFTHKAIMNQLPNMMLCESDGGVGGYGTYFPSQPTDTLLTFQDSMSTGDCVMYFWCEVPGYSKVGEYEGNGSEDGTFIWTGFKPAFVLIKCYSASNTWILYDSVSNPGNTNNTKFLQLARTDQQYNTGKNADLLSNGFKLRQNMNEANINNGKYVWMAFAESPFRGEGIPPATAR